MPDKIVKVVVVLYYPDDDTIAFFEQFCIAEAKIIVVVNGIDDSQLSRLSEIRLDKLVINQENLGLAKALNQGCEYAFQSGATHVLMLDQDSRPDFGLPQELVSDWEELQAMNRTALAAIGPTLVDVKGEVGAIMPADRKGVAVNSLATSGTLISKEAFDRVGPMREWLFIDCIDHDWCFRAWEKKLSVVQITKRQMLHDMGDDGVTILGRYRPLHRSPVRHFYVIRNTLFMIRQAHVPLLWRVREALKMFYRIPIYLAASTDRKKTAHNILMALRDGRRK